MRFGRGTLGACLARVEAEAEGGDWAALPSRLNSQSEALASGRREDPRGAGLWPHQVLPDSREPGGRDTAVAWAGLVGRRAQGRRQRPQGERGAWAAPLLRDPSRVREAPRPLCGCCGARPRRPGDQQMHLAGAEAPARQ